MNIGGYFSDFVSLIYPNLCIGCDSPLPKGSKYICPKCHYNLPKTNTYRLKNHSFREKFDGIVPVEHVLVYAFFIKNGIMQHILHDLKYKDNQEIGRMIGMWFGHELLLGGYADAFDCIIPVPLHESRLKSRGYNQAVCFGEGLSDALRVPIELSAMSRVKNVDTQTKKSKVNRIRNVDSIFEMIKPDEIEHKRVLLVDDVLTTGSTLISCVEPIVANGAKSVSIAVMAGVK